MNARARERILLVLFFVCSRPREDEDDDVEGETVDDDWRVL